jgi:hypothetical protein
VGICAPTLVAHLYRGGGTRFELQRALLVEPHAELLITPRCSTPALSHRYLQLPLQYLAALGHWSEDSWWLRFDSDSAKGLFYIARPH